MTLREFITKSIVDVSMSAAPGIIDEISFDLCVMPAHRGNGVPGIENTIVIDEEGSPNSSKIRFAIKLGAKESIKHTPAKGTLSDFTGTFLLTEAHLKAVAAVRDKRNCDCVHKKGITCYKTS